MKKNILLQLAILLLCLELHAQSIHRSVIGAAGMVHTSGNIQLSATTGEALTSTLSSANYRITQGFQQGKKPDSITVYVIAYLQGYYGGSYAMRPALLNQGQSADPAIADTITIELHPAAAPHTIAAEIKTLLHTNGNAICKMPIAPGDYYMVIKHRNHIETWSANPIPFTGAFAGYDFTYAAAQAYGNNLVEIEPGLWALYSGDINQDENADLLDLSTLEADISDFGFGYLATDLNGDANVDLLDIPMLEANINAFVFSNHP